MSISVSNFNGIFNFDGFDMLNTLEICFYDAVVTSDFGLLKSGTKYSSISVDYENNVIRTFIGSDPNPIDVFNFIMKPYDPEL